VSTPRSQCEFDGCRTGQGPACSEHASPAPLYPDEELAAKLAEEAGPLIRQWTREEARDDVLRQAFHKLRAAVELLWRGRS
jgi:hypothetical protein